MNKYQRRMVLERRQRVSSKANMMLQRLRMWKSPSVQYKANHMRQVIMDQIKEKKG